MTASTLTAFVVPLAAICRAELIVEVRVDNVGVSLIPRMLACDLMEKKCYLEMASRGLGSIDRVRWQVPSVEVCESLV